LNFFKITLIFILTQMALAEKVEVTADTMHAESLNKEIHFVGNAKVKQLKDWIHADEIIIYLDDNNETKMYKAVGKANFEFENDKGHYKGNAEVVEYYPLKSLYTLIGKANVNDLRNKRTAKGDKITVDMITGRSNVVGTKNRPVKFTFDMDKKK